MNGMNLMYRLQHKVLPLVIAGVVGLIPALAGIHPSRSLENPWHLHCATIAFIWLYPYGTPKEAIL